MNGYLIGPYYFFDDNTNQHKILQLLRDNLPGLLEDFDLVTSERTWIQYTKYAKYLTIPKQRDWPWSSVFVPDLT